MYSWSGYVISTYFYLFHAPTIILLFLFYYFITYLFRIFLYYLFIIYLFYGHTLTAPSCIIFSSAPAAIAADAPHTGPAMTPDNPPVNAMAIIDPMQKATKVPSLIPILAKCWSI